MIFLIFAIRNPIKRNVMRKLEMKSLRRMLAVALAWGMACLAWAQTAKPLEVREMKLGNGMTV